MLLFARAPPMCRCGVVRVFHKLEVAFVGDGVSIDVKGGQVDLLCGRCVSVFIVTSDKEAAGADVDHLSTVVGDHT